MKKLLYLFILIIPVFLFGFNPVSTFASSLTKEVDLKEESQSGGFLTEYTTLSTNYDYFSFCTTYITRTFFANKQTIIFLFK
ncbi:hypothetical protein ACXM0N_03970 [Peribacillus simplex]